MLTEQAVHALDTRAVFIGAEAYTAAGGVILRDLFEDDDGGYLQDAPLLERLVGEKLAAAAEEVRGEGWAWVEAAVDFPWNHHRDFRALKPVSPALTKAEAGEYDRLAEELNELEADAEGDLASADEQRIEARIAEIQVKLAEYDARVPGYSPKQKAHAGCFVSIADDGKVLIERGYQRPRAAMKPSAGNGLDGDGEVWTGEEDGELAGEAGNGQANSEGDGLSEKLLTELTVYHSLGLRNALAANHGVAYLAVLNALVLGLFYRGYTSNNCLQIQARDTITDGFEGLAEFGAGKAIQARHEAFEKLLPRNEAEVWDALLQLTPETREALFAHCAGLTVNAVPESFGRSHKRRHAGQLAEALELDMQAQGFTPTAANYFGRVKKPQILEAVTEAKGEEAAAAIAGHKKGDMAAEAERLLAGTSWLPKPLRAPALDVLAIEEAAA